MVGGGGSMEEKGKADTQDIELVARDSSAVPDDSVLADDISGVAGPGASSSRPSVSGLRCRKTIVADDLVVPEDIASPEMASDRLSWAVKLCYGLPQFAMTPLTLVLAIHANTYYEKMGATLSFLAFGTAFARSWDVITDPGMGWLSDNTRRFKLGRRRPYMLGGMWIYAVSFVLLMNPPITTDPDDNATSWWFTIFYVLFYIGDTIAGVPYSSLGPELSSNPDERTQAFFFAKLYAGMGTLLGAVAPEAFRQGLIARKSLPDGVEETAAEDKETTRQAFLLTGLVFSSIYVISMLIVCWVCKEKATHAPVPSGTAAHTTPSTSPETAMSEDSPPLPLVPSVLRALNNRAFRPLLAAWVMDAVALALIAASFPFYITYVIVTEDSAYESDTIMAACFAALFIAALLGMPAWLALSKRAGRYRTWQFMNIANALTNSLFILVGEGDVKFAVIAAGINGLPLGASFLTDSILADVIQYDYAINGTHSEGSFSTFSSLVPKLCSVPASAVPLSIMFAMGFKKSENGEPMDQPENVKHLIRFVFVFFPLMLTIASYFVKRLYPIKTEELNERIREMGERHEMGKPARDPLTGRVVEIMEVDPADRDTVNLFDHFSHKILTFLSTSPSPDFLVRRTILQTGMGAFGIAVFATLTLAFIPSLNDPVVSVVPIISVIFAGGATCYTGFSILRLSAAKQIAKTLGGTLAIAAGASDGGGKDGSGNGGGGGEEAGEAGGAGGDSTALEDSDRNVAAALKVRRLLLAVVEHKEKGQRGGEGLDELEDAEILAQYQIRAVELEKELEAAIVEQKRLAAELLERDRIIAELKKKKG